MRTSSLLSGRAGAAGALVLLAAAPGAAPAQAPAIDPRAEELLQASAAYLASRDRFSVDVIAAFDTHQPSGQKIEFAEIRRITVARPDRMRVEVEESSGDAHLLLYDGTNLTVSTPGSNVYAQVPLAGTIDQAVVFFVRELKMRLPLAALLLTTAPQELAQRTWALDYVEHTGILGVPAHHLAGRAANVDYQVWVADADAPLPLRVVLTYAQEEGQPQFRAQFVNWNTAPAIDAARFAFSPPADARRVAFLVELTPPAEGSAPAAPAK